jgi:hypothetical protein
LKSLSPPWKETTNRPDGDSSFPAPLRGKVGYTSRLKAGVLPTVPIALTLAARRDPRPRRLDLMIAAITSVRGLPLFTRNVEDFKGAEDAVTVVSI